VRYTEFRIRIQSADERLGRRDESYRNAPQRRREREQRQRREHAEFRIRIQAADGAATRCSAPRTPRRIGSNRNQPTTPPVYVPRFEFEIQIAKARRARRSDETYLDDAPWSRIDGSGCQLSVFGRESSVSESFASRVVRRTRLVNTVPNNVKQIKR